MHLSEARYETMSKEQIEALLFDERYQIPQKADYAILLGTEPTYAVLRAEIAASYYAQGGAPRIIATGAAVHDASGTESAIMRRWLLELGIPSDAVTEEPNARDTIGNMVYSLGVMYACGNLSNIKRVTIITEPFHLRRSLALARLFLPKYIEVCGYTEGTDDQRASWRTDARLLRSVKTEIDILSSLARDGWVEDLSVDNQ